MTSEIINFKKLEGEIINFKELKGQIITEFNIDQDESIISIKTASGKYYEMFHERSCCENVYLVSITRDYKDILLNQEILEAIETIDTGCPDKEENEHGAYVCSCSYAFYKLITPKGFVDMRWYGESNGNYSETVSLFELIL